MAAGGMRLDRENVAPQVDALSTRMLELRSALADLHSAAKGAMSRIEDLSEVYGAMSAVRRAEEAFDLARLDLATARGEDA